VSVQLQYSIEGRTASAIAASVEEGIREGRLSPGSTLPTVRALAARLGVSPATVSAGYQTLQGRGLVSGRGRRGTRVNSRPPIPGRPDAPVPAHVRNLADGNPDPELLPALGRALSASVPGVRLYGEPPDLPRLVERARDEFYRDGVSADAVAVVGGALDGIERVLQAHLRPGDVVAVEDPAHAGLLDLLGALGLVVEPVAIDDEGPLPAALDAAIRGGAVAAVVTPRAQSPRGSALTPERGRVLRGVLRQRTELLLIEDDHAGPVSGAPAVLLSDSRRERWAVVRSVSKSLGPDLRLAVLTGSPSTIARVQGRQLVGTGWVSHVLQRVVADLWADSGVQDRLREAARTYAARREALVVELGRRGIEAHGRSGFNVWVPVPAEVPVVAALAERGWAVREGERYRLRSGPAIRVTISTLLPEEAASFAADLSAVLRRPRLTSA
jgi:DNA-binding transcriptional MocR family regulator